MYVQITICRSAYFQAYFKNNSPQFPWMPLSIPCGQPQKCHPGQPPTHFAYFLRAATPATLTPPQKNSPVPPPGRVMGAAIPPPQSLPVGIPMGKRGAVGRGDWGRFRISPVGGSRWGQKSEILKSCEGAAFQDSSFPAFQHPRSIPSTLQQQEPLAALWASMARHTGQ